MQTPGSGGGTSNTLQFEIDSATGSTGIAPPSFPTPTATVTAGGTANYQVTLPSSATNVSVSCLNLPTGVSCSYSTSSKAVSVTTSTTTPKGTYQIVVVFQETVTTGTAAAGFLVPFLLLPLAFLKKKLNARGIVFAAVLAIGLAVAFLATGCGGSGTHPTPAPTTATSTVTSSGAVTLTVQ